MENIKFAKYAVLVPELRQHMLPYLNRRTLLNYSLCSRYCNSEIQKFKTKPPIEVYLLESNNDITVTSLYRGSVGPKFVRKIFTVPTYVPLEEKTRTTMDDVEKYLISVYQYVKGGKTQKLTVNLKNWTTGIMQITNLSELDYLKVDMKYSMLDDFVEFVKNSTVKVRELCLGDWSNNITVYKNHTKPIFNSNWFKQISKVEIDLDCEIDDEDFLDFENHTITLRLQKHMISRSAICQKVEQLNNSSKCNKIDIHVAYGSTKFNIDHLFPNHQQIDFSDFRAYQDGNVVVRVADNGFELYISKNVTDNV